MADPYKTLMMNPEDKVAVALERIEKSAEVRVTSGSQSFTVQLRDSIEFGHKFAVADIDKGEDILKYGEIIGAATENILKGEHVHVHNLEGKRGRGDKVGEKQRV